jgi:hypothetical protein
VATKPNLISDRLPPDMQLPTKQMHYAAQVVWCIAPDDSDMKCNAEGLHGKSFAAGDATADNKRSAIVFGLSPNWPQVPDQTGNVRLYIVAHGVNVSGSQQPLTVKIATRGNRALDNVLSADDFFPYLQQFIQKSTAKRVRRISLAMCNSGGIKGEILPQNSFAQKLVSRCAGLTDDITARMGALDVGTTSSPKAGIDAAYKRKGGENPLFTIVVDGAQESVLNARKLVDDASHSRTYIFTPTQAPRLKPGYKD